MRTIVSLGLTGIGCRSIYRINIEMFAVISCSQGRPSPEAMMHFPLFQISPLFSTNFQTLWKIPKMLPFPEKIFDFHPPKFIMTSFFSHRPHISNFAPYIFSVWVHFPHVSRKLLFPPTFKIPPLFSKNSPAFYILYVYFVSPLLWPWCMYA